MLRYYVVRSYLIYKYLQFSFATEYYYIKLILNKELWRKSAAKHMKKREVPCKFVTLLGLTYKRIRGKSIN
jgi:hypothetical protein